MQNNQNTHNSGSVGFLGFLTLLFIGLKLTGYIDWSWFWVLSPILLGILFVLILVLIIIYVEYKDENKSSK